MNFNFECLCSEAVIYTYERYGFLYCIKRIINYMMTEKNNNRQKFSGSTTIVSDSGDLSVEDFISHLQGLDIKIRVDNDRIHCNAPKDVMTPELRSLISKNKVRIIEYYKRIGQTGAKIARITEPVLPVEKRDNLPLSYAQERLWFLNKLEGADNNAYNMPVRLRFVGPLDVNALELSLNEIVRRHEILRTNFREVDGNAVQVVSHHLKINLSIMDLQGVDECDRTAELQRISVEDAQTPFKIDTDPLLRSTLLILCNSDKNDVCTDVKNKTGRSEYILLITMHHIVSDGLSQDIIKKELFTLYEAFHNGLPSPLPELDIQYADFACWQRKNLQNQSIQSRMEYWRKQLEGAPAFIELPVDKPRPPVRTFQGQAEFMEIDGDMSDALEVFSREEGITFFITTFTLFNVLIYRYTGVDDVVIGAPVAGRDYPGLENLIGFFNNTVVLRNDLSGNPTFRELLKRVRNTALGAFEHQDLPFEKLVEELRPERNLSHTPLFQIFFNMFNPLDNKMELSGLTIESLPTPEIASKFDLTMYVSRSRDGIKLAILYDSDLFNPPRIKELLEQYKLLMIQVVNAPDVTINSLSLITPGAKSFLPDPSKPLRSEWCGSIQDKFYQQTNKAPERVAIVADDVTLNYGELNELSNRLANCLLAQGIVQQDVVAIYGPRSALLVLSVLGVMKASAAFIILDPAYPSARLMRYMDKAKPRAIIQFECKDKRIKEFTNDLCSLVCINLGSFEAGSVRETLKEFSPEKPGVKIDADGLAYIAFTSGSTGEPQGVLGTLRPLTHFLHWHCERFDFNENDRFSVLSGLSHDPLLRDIFTPLWLGASMFISKTDFMDDDKQLVRWMRLNSITISHLTPAMGKFMSSSIEFARGDVNTVLPSLRYLFFGGDTLTGGDVRRAKKLAPLAVCVNFYGATETPQAMGYYIVQDRDAQNDVDESVLKDRLPVGCGIDGVQLLLLNDSGQLAGVGEIGEIYVRTPYLSKGYLDNNQLTNERFLLNKFSGDARDRLYRTGDLGRFSPVGSIEISGRVDRQVSIRGFRVDLKEIESGLLRYESVIDAVVLCRNDGIQGNELTAYVKNRNGALLNGLGDFLRQELPDYMIPAFFVELDQIPLTPNGKVDEKALPFPSEINRADSSDFLAPRNEVEISVANVWLKMLNITTVDVRDNFFEIGGHSLKAVQMINRINNELGCNLALRDIFNSPTIDELAKKIDSKSDLTRLSIEKEPDREHYPVSRAQRRLWVLSQLSGASSAYNMPGACLMEGDVDIVSLAHAFQELTQRHDSLRTTFIVVDGAIRQKIHENTSFDIHFLDVSNYDNPEKYSREFAETDAMEMFDLEKGPLLRASILKLTADKHVLIFNIHHVIADGWSLGVLVRELVQLYDSHHNKKNASLPELRCRYRDYTAWQNRFLESEAINPHQEYGRQKFFGEVPVLNIPTDFSRPATKTFNGKRVIFDIDEKQTNKLLSFCNERNVSLFMALSALVNVLLYRYTNQADIIVGSPVAGRNHPDLEGQIGFYVNMMILRCQLQEDAPFDLFLAQVKDEVVEALSHDSYPFDQLVDELNLSRDASRSPLFDVVVVLQNPDNPEFTLSDVKITPLDQNLKTCKYDLEFYFEQKADKLQVTICYNSDLFLEKRIECLRSHLLNLLSSVLADPSTPVSALNILSESERDTILNGLNGVDSIYPQDKTIVSLLEEQVKASPNATALVFDESAIDYKELNERANQLAHYLRRRGVVPNSVVAVIEERSIAFVVTILGVLKAGGAYLPIDNKNPLERILSILKSSRTELVLTRSSALNNITLIGNDGIKAINQANTVAKFLQGSNDDARDNGLLRDVVMLDEREPEIASEMNDNPPWVNTPTDLAYVIFTSGSTGNPKGCGIMHRNLVRLMKNENFCFDFGADDVWVVAHSFAFDFSVWEMYGALLYGGRAVIARREVVQEANSFRDFIHKHRVTVLNQTPAAFYNLIEANRANNSYDLGSHLRYVIFGGDRLDPVYLTQWVQDYSMEDVKLINMYGITETTVHVTFGPVQESDIHAGKGRSPIGVPLPETKVYICDRHMNIQPVGVPGEIYVGGTGVSKGYLNRPDLTAERFIESPFRQGERLYRSGDLGCWMFDGRLEHLGRNDNQVQIRGYRIELGEIEAVLVNHAHVKESVVVVQGELEHMRLVAYVVPYKLENMDVEGLRGAIKKRLPDYMMPATFVTLSELPLTINGKIDRKALPLPCQNRARPGTDYMAPRSELEESIADIWKDILEIDHIGVDDNFFDMGGNSLLLIQVHNRLKDVIDHGFSAITLFRYPTISAISSYLTSNGKAVKPDLEKIDERVRRHKDRKQQRAKAAQRIKKLRGDKLR